jgi:hypothetical protein
MSLRASYPSLAVLVVVAGSGWGPGCGGTTSPLSIHGGSGAPTGNPQNEAGADLDGAAQGTGGAQAVSLFVLVGEVHPCPTGYAHPNACCNHGACREDPSAPFVECDGSSLTFPDRRTCCALGDGSDCASASIVDATLDAAAPAACSLPCGPEGYPAAETQFAVCSNVPSVASCVFCCSGLGCPSDMCSCPAEPPCACNTPRCGACPVGWEAQAAQVDLCCQAGPGDPQKCFSQSAQVRAPTEGSADLSGPNGCDDYKFADGHVYEVLCDSTKTPQCTCSLDGTITDTFALSKDGCSFSICGFPQ